MELELVKAKDALAKEKEKLNHIFKDLKVEYKDYKSVENMEMSLELGENLRDQLKNIFFILEKEGIKF